jgi:hypothetical protein
MDHATSSALLLATHFTTSLFPLTVRLIRGVSSNGTENRRKDFLAICLIDGQGGVATMVRHAPTQTWDSGVCKASRSNHADDTDTDPEYVEEGIGTVLFDDRAPREYDSIRRVKGPDKEERARGSEPTDQRKGEDPHQYPDHLDGTEISSHCRVQPAQEPHGHLSLVVESCLYVQFDEDSGKNGLVSAP